MVFPSASKTGIALRTSASSPPTMMESRASIAPTSPPETGASRVRTPFAPARSLTRRSTSGEMVLMSIHSCPAFAPSIAPSLPKSTASTSGEFVTMMTSTSTSRARSRGVAAAFAPSFARASAFARVRFHTVRGKPAFRRFRAIGEPMIPSPMTPTRSMA